MGRLSNTTCYLEKMVKQALTAKGSLLYNELCETATRHQYLFGTKATIHKMVEAMSKEEAEYLLYLILEHADFKDRPF